jgi:DNA-binding NtrC family response regulator
VLQAPEAPAPPRENDASVSSGLKNAVATTERETILQALARNQWNLTRTASDLMLSRSTLYAKIHQYGISNRTQWLRDGGRGQ